MLPSGSATPLRPSDFSFYGFDDLVPQLEHSLGDLVIRHGEPVAPVVEDAVFVPPVEMAERGHFEGALLNCDGQPITTAQAQRRFGAFGEQILGRVSDPVDIRPEEVVNEEVVYLGWHIGHFGHFLLESLARSWILDQIDPAIRVVFHVEREQKLSGTTLRILEAFGVPRDRILVLDRQTVLRRVIVPEALYEIAHAAHERMALPFRRVAAAMIGNPDQSDQPLYLSRRLLPSTQRPIVGEFDMEELLRENGFLVVHPETMTFEDQVRTVNRHRDIFTSAGSAAYASLFCVRPPTLHILTSGLPIPDYFLVPKAIGASAVYSNCFARENQPELYYLPSMVEMDKLSGYLDSVGLLRKRLRASLAARLTVLDARYEDARLYTYVRHSIVRGNLPAEVEAKSLNRAQSSWPLSWVLASYYAPRDPARTDELVQQFITLVSRESDIIRLAYFYEEIKGRARRVASQCTDHTTGQLAEVLLDRLGIEPDAKRQRSEQRHVREEARANKRRERSEGRRARKDAREKAANDHSEAV